MLPKGVQFGFEWGDGFVAWNEVGPPEAVFDTMPHGACAWAEEHHSTDPRFEIDLDSTMIHNQTFLNKICALSQVQIDRHVSRHGSFLVARDFIGTQTLGLSQAKIDGCMVDITFPTPYWVNGTSYPSRASTRQSRKTLPVVWRGRTTGGGIAQNTDWRKVSLERYIHV